MRIGLFSDIHGNFTSLEAVLADLEQQNLDSLICLGDIATLGPCPCETVAAVRALGCPVICGNHEAYLEIVDKGGPVNDVEIPDWLTDRVQWTYDQLSADDLKWLESFPATLEIPLEDGASLLCVHGSPRSNMDFLLATTPPDVVDEWMRGYHPPFMATGHTHVQMLRQHKGMLIANVGSVGMPFQQMPFEGDPHYLPWAEYAVIEEKHGVFDVDLRRVPFDFEEVLAQADDSSNPHAALWRTCWIQPGEV